MKAAKDIIRETAGEYGIGVEDMCSTGRHRPLPLARFDAMNRLRAIMRADGRHRFSTIRIGKMLGGRDHTTVLNGLRRWEELRGASAPNHNKTDFQHTEGRG